MQDTDEIRVALSGQVYAAPVGSTVPDDIDTAWDAAWVDLGYTTEDGITLTESKTLTEKRGWPSPRVLRRWAGTRDTTVDFTLIQLNAENLLRTLGGGAVTEPEAGVFRYEPPADEDLGTFALGVEFVDGDYTYRWVFPNGLPDGDVTIPMNRQDSVELPLSFKAQVPSDAGDVWFMLTDDPAFEPAES